MRNLALFDFDKTLYNKDSLIEFTKFCKGSFNFYFGLIFLFPVIFFMKLRLISNEKAKIIFFKYYFKGMDYSIFKSLAVEFGSHKISENLNKHFFDKFIHHFNSNDDLYIVTASVPLWIMSWSEKYNVKIIGTEIEIVNNIITGNFTTKNCNGIEKVKRIKQEINLDIYNKIFVYGKGKGDREMLQLSC